MKKLLYFLLFVSCFTTTAQTSLENQITDVMKKYEAVGLGVSVVKNGKPVFEKSFGKKSIEENTNIAQNDIFRIASISKSFSATAIMQLVEDKKLSLNDDISDLIGFKVRNPKYPDTKITVKMMLSHTSSLNDSQGYFELDVINPSKGENWEKCYNDYSPGSDYQYCNLNFNMIGTIIEKISGERFDQYVVNHILKPLGLYGGYWVESLDAKKFVTLYNYENGFVASPGAYNPRTEEIKNYVMGYSTPIFSPTGGMKISPSDLSKYMVMHMNFGKVGKTRIIKKKSSKLMQTPLSSEEGYGLALSKTSKMIEGETLVGHTGSAYGLYSSMFFSPLKKFGIVVMTNGCKDCTSSGYNKLIQEVNQLLYDALIK